MNFYSNRVLLIEDDEFIHYDFKDVLFEKNYLGTNGLFDSAYSYDEGIEKIGQNEYDLAVIDIELGKGKRNGLFMITPCLQKEIVPIMATAYSDKTLYDKAYLMGALGYYLKKDSNYISNLIEESKEVVVNNKLKLFFKKIFILNDLNCLSEISTAIKTFDSSSPFTYICGPDSYELCELIFKLCSTTPVKVIDFIDNSEPIKLILKKTKNLIIKNYLMASSSDKKIIANSANANKIFFCEKDDILKNNVLGWGDIISNIIQIKIPNYLLRPNDSYAIFTNKLEFLLNKKPPLFTSRAVSALKSYPWSSQAEIHDIAHEISHIIINNSPITIVDIDYIPKKVIDLSNITQINNVTPSDYFKIIQDCEEKGLNQAMKDLRQIIAEYEIGVAGSLHSAAKRIHITGAGLRKMLLKL